MADNGSLPPHPAAARLIRLEYEGGRLRISRVGEISGYNPDPIKMSLPRLPASTVVWCSAVARRFRSRRRGAVCLALVLTLDLATRRWIPIVPTQTCTRRGARLDLIDTDYAHFPPDVVIAGSFQTLDPGDMFDAAGAVPAFGGVHVVEQRRGGRRSAVSLLFLRIDATAEAALADPAAIVVDDLDQALRDAAGRLRVE